MCSRSRFSKWPGIGAGLSMLALAHLACAIELSAVSSESLLDCAGSASAELTLPDGSAPLEVRVGDAGIVFVEELGQEIVVASFDGAVVEVSTPPRFGQAQIDMKGAGRILLSRARPGSAPGAVRIRLTCAPTIGERARLQWMARVAQVETAFLAPLDAEKLDALVLRIAEVGAEAASPQDVALAAHLRAQAYLIAGRSSDASSAFDVALHAWLAVADSDRALAALVARAEDLHRTAAYAQVLQATHLLADRPDPGRYFSVRLENSRCLALHYLGRLEESSICYQWTIARLDELGESLELISTLQDYAQLERDRGDLSRAAELAQQSLAMILLPQWDTLPGPDVPIVRGRVHRLLGDLAMRRGDVGEGLRQAQRSLDMFTLAANPRWQGNTMLRIAAIYREVGAYDDAYEAITASFERFNRRDAPARIAAALATLAEVNLADGNAEQARLRSRQAASEFMALRMDTDALAAKLLEAEATSHLGQSQQVRSMLETMDALPSAYAQRAALIESEVTDDTQPLRARQWYLDLAGEPRPLSEWLRAQIAAARGLGRLADHVGARQTLESAADHLTELAWRSRSPVLRLALERKRRVLRAAALLNEISPLTTTLSPDTVWRWTMRADTALPTRTIERHDSSASEFDRALAQSMLPPARLNAEKARYTDTGLERRLLAVVAADAPDLPGLPPPAAGDQSLLRTQEILPADTMLLVLLDTAPSIQILAISHDSSVVKQSSLQADELNLIVKRLKRGVADVRTSQQSIDADAALLSNALLGPIAGSSGPPRHLLIYAPEPFNGLPWSLLQWPSTRTPLIESTAVSLVLLRRGAAQGLNQTGPGTIHIVAADAQATGIAALPVLAGAAIEPSMVQQGAHRSGRSSTLIANPTRGSVLEALGESDAWVHIAAHGANHPGYIGRSGIWLSSPDAGQLPEILSWLEIVEHGVRADLVVLNACALAASSRSSISASVGFAEAVVRAGAQDVVAALWPVSDTASTQWVSAFYQKFETPQPTSYEIADAVRHAALRLRASRMFRHPSHWAALVHWTDLDVSTVAPAIAARSTSEQRP